MHDEPPITPAELARQVSRHADSLRAAGVAFLPATTALTLPLVSTPPVETETPAPQPALPFDFVEAATAPVLNVEQRLQELQALRQRVAACARCPQLASTRTQTVFGVGPLDPDLCFIGEAPGEDEDRLGEPFVGAAGQLLNRIIAAMGMKREEVYICNILRCRPPGNRTPTAEEATHCREYLERTLDLVRPKYICALGACAAQNLLGTTTGIGRLRGRFQRYNDVAVLCTYHPAYLLPHRSPEKKKDVWEDMKLLLAKMGRKVPGK
jgi:uracil-DNA glycosylase family 4